MKRKLLPALFPVLLIVLSMFLTSTAAADAPAAPAAYYLDNAMYVFAQFPDFVPEYEGDAPQASLLVNGTQIGEEVSGKKLAAPGSTAHYMLLVDNSGSMSLYSQQVQRLADGLMAAAPNVSVTVAAFGDEFRVVATELRDAAAVRDALSRHLRYNDQGSDISGGAIYAVDHMKKAAWDPGALSSIILITDGEAFYSYDTEAEARSEKEAADALRQVLTESPQVLLHAVSFADWEKTTHEAVISAAGLDLTVRSDVEAEDAGSAIAGYYENLFALEFPLTAYADDLALRLSPTDIITVRHVGDLNVPPEDLPNHLPGVIDNENSAEETMSPQATPESMPVPPEVTPTPEPPEPGSTEEPEPLEDMIAHVPEEPGPETELSEEVSVPSVNLILFAAIGCVSMVLVIVLLILLLTRRNKNRNIAPTASVRANGPAFSTTSGVAIPMRLEVLSGMVRGEAQREFVLSNSFFIGSDGRCDLILSDDSVSPMNTRVYYQDGSVYIEDLNSMTGTALGGMRIYAPNRLRSGDDILIGQCCFRLYF